ncbi:MAG: hypothetical protein FJW39_29820 [Acidobacteria bacterium]|nr:hypothetical protein [Acidobacteriota bacterium]
MKVAVEVSEQLYDRASRIAGPQQVTVEEFFADICELYVRDWERLKVLDQVPDVEPDECGRLPGQS